MTNFDNPVTTLENLQQSSCKNNRYWTKFQIMLLYFRKQKYITELKVLFNESKWLVTWFQPSLWFQIVACDQIGRFSKVLGEIFCFKSSPNVQWLWAILKNVPFEVKTDLATFWATFEKIGALLISGSGHTASIRSVVYWETVNL